MIVRLKYSKLHVDDGPNIYAKYALVQKVERINAEYDHMDAQLWDMRAQKFDGVWRRYTFKGARVTHSDDDGRNPKDIPIWEQKGSFVFCRSVP